MHISPEYDCVWDFNWILKSIAKCFVIETFKGGKNKAYDGCSIIVKLPDSLLWDEFALSPDGWVWIAEVQRPTHVKELVPLSTGIIKVTLNALAQGYAHDKFGDPVETLSEINSYSPSINQILINFVKLKYKDSVAVIDNELYLFIDRSKVSPTVGKQSFLTVSKLRLKQAGVKAKYQAHSTENTVYNLALIEPLNSAKGK